MACRPEHGQEVGNTMVMKSLNPGGAITMPAAGMFQIKAHALGTGEPVRLVVDGQAQHNQVDAATVKVLQVTGDLRLIVAPARGGEFGPGASAQIVLSRGRPGTDAAEGVELPPISLDGRSEATAGTVSLQGSLLHVRAVTGNETNLEGPASTVGAALRSAFDSQGVYPPSGLALRLHLDRSASMSVPAVREHLDTAVSVVVGAASIACSGGTITLVTDGSEMTLSGPAELPDAVTASSAEAVRRIGGGESVSTGKNELTFVISDSAPAAVVDGSSNAVALVLGNQPRPRHPMVVTVDEAVSASLERKRHDAIGEIVDAVVAATRNIVKETHA